MSKFINPSRRQVLAGGLAAPLLVTASRPLAAQEKYPSRPVRFIVQFPPGSGTDTMARLIAKVLTEWTGQAFVVENRPGGAGFIAAQAVLSSAADGYTVFFGANATLAANAVLFKKVPYDALEDFTAVAIVFRNPCLLIVPAKSPYRTLADLIADAKKRPGALNYGGGSIGYQIFTEWLNDIAQIKTTNIPFKGAGEVVTAVVGGQVDYGVVDAGAPAELVKNGTVRALVFTSETRSTQVPDVPTSAEAGAPGFLPTVWVGCAVPAKTPTPIVDQLETLIQQALASPDVKAYLERTGAAPPKVNRAGLRQIQIDEIERFRHIMSVAKIEPQ